MESNVSLVRDVEGNLFVYVAGVKMQGQKNTQVVLNPDGHQTLVVGVPMLRVTLAEEAEVASLAATTVDNVIYPEAFKHSSDNADGDVA